MKYALNRRTLLKGTLGGAALSFGLPPLDIFFNGNGNAYANGDALPKRFGIFYWGNGNLPEKWNPVDQGENWTLSEQLAPLADVKDKLAVITGTAVKIGNTVPHHSGTAGILGDAPLDAISTDDFIYRAPTIDQIIANEIGGETRFRSIEVCVQKNSGVSQSGPNQPKPPEWSPKALFDRIFSDGFQLPGDDPIIDPKLSLRRSVLDAVSTDITRLKQRVGSTDRERLDKHFEGVRDLERRLQKLEEDPPNLEACAYPPTPLDEYPKIDGRIPMKEISRAMADILAMALACDQTRVFSNSFSFPVNNVLYDGLPAGHHRLTHDEQGDQPLVNSIVKLIMTELNYFLKTLGNVQEGDSTLLDNCAVLCTSDVSFGRLHQLDDFPIIIAGSAGGAIKSGFHYRSSSGENASHVCFSLARAMGLSISEFGLEAGLVNSGLSALDI